MASFRPLKFTKAAGTLGVTSVALSVVLFVLSIVEHVRDKNVPAYVFIYLAAIFFAVGAYMTWSAAAPQKLSSVHGVLRPRPAIGIPASH
jgi:hypothetical protein